MKNLFALAVIGLFSVGCGGAATDSGPTPTMPPAGGGGMHGAPPSHDATPPADGTAPADPAATPAEPTPATDPAATPAEGTTPANP